MANKIDGRAVAATTLEKVAKDVATLREGGWVPRLVSIRIGDDTAVDLYVRNQQRNAETVGIEFVEKQYPVEISEAEVHAAIVNLNVDPRVTGIILQRPIPDNLPIKRLQATVHPLKDVEGVRRQNLLDTKWPELRETLAHQVVL